MCDGNYIENGYEGSSPSVVDGVHYLTTYEEDSALDLALFGLDRLLPEWRKPNWGLPVLDLGPGRKIIPNTVRIDWPQYDFEARERWETVGNFDRKVMVLRPEGLLPYADNSVGGVFAVNILEHLWDPRPLIWEVARVLAPGAVFNVFVPHAHSLVYAQDLDHKKPFILDTWKTLLANPYYEKGHPSHQLGIGANFKFAVKEGNEIIVTQLIKKEASA